MEHHSTEQARCAGIDVGKDWLDIALDPSGERWRVRNDAAGRAAVVETFAKQGIERVGLEATGSYEFEIAEALRAAGFAVIVFQPKQVKAYGIFRLKRAKSDRVDARLVARCTRAQETVREAPDPRLIPLAEHLTWIEQIEEDLARAKIRRERFRDERILDALEAEIERLKTQKRAELKRLGQAVRAVNDLAHRLDLLISVQGIGERTALALVILMPELGRLTREEAAALAGVAPFVQESGRYKGERHTGGGRARVRTSLFAAAQPAAQRWNPALVAFSDRLKARGKPHAVVIVACVRKLLIYANAVLARDTPWEARGPAVTPAASSAPACA